MEFWAIARYDLGLTDDEFWELTPLQFKALRKRQEIEFRHKCFVAAIAAADYRNAHRYESGDKVWSPLDYVVCEGGDTDLRREEAKHNIAAAYVLVGSMTPAQAAKRKENIIRSLRDQGFEDADALFGEVFPED